MTRLPSLYVRVNIQLSVDFQRHSASCQKLLSCLDQRFALRIQAVEVAELQTTKRAVADWSPKDSREKSKNALAFPVDPIIGCTSGKARRSAFGATSVPLKNAQKVPHKAIFAAVKFGSSDNSPHVRVHFRPTPQIRQGIIPSRGD